MRNRTTATTRCGFARYFVPGLHGDHWVCENWSASTMRWVPPDSQLGPELCRDLGVTFDPAAVPRDQFVVAGDAWKRCRDGDLAGPARTVRGPTIQRAGNFIRHKNEEVY
ncbi:hypothetical protein ACIA5C_09275 [Actinoplanes sp. NPDC051343]|uniref:hypothetical protein n=1 Tax=Actinoplanes sp. NPDC051343 TaxID=3363906 RepID=UPI00379224FC